MKHPSLLSRRWLWSFPSLSERTKIQGNYDSSYRQTLPSPCSESPSSRHNPQLKTSMLPAARNLLKTRPMLRFPHPPSGCKGESPLMQSTTGWYYIHIHFPSGITSVKSSITCQEGQPLPNATSSIMTHIRRRAAMTLMEASILSLWSTEKDGWMEAGTTFPTAVDCNEQTEAVTPILRSGGQSLWKLNFWWTHHNSFDFFTRCNLSVWGCR